MIKSSQQQHFLLININKRTVNNKHNKQTVTLVLTVKNEDEKIDSTYHVEEMNTTDKLLESRKKTKTS